MSFGRAIHCLTKARTTIGLADVTDVDSPKCHVIVDFGKSADLERKDPLLGLE